MECTLSDLALHYEIDIDSVVPWNEHRFVSLIHMYYGMLHYTQYATAVHGACVMMTQARDYTQ